MVDRLEQENPGCFDDPDATFADLYMKSGMYVTEIVTRLYQSKRMKALYPDEAERLNHIFCQAGIWMRSDGDHISDLPAVHPRIQRRDTHREK